MMRRSKAPSVLNKAKRLYNSNNLGNNFEVECHGSDPEDKQYNWGSRTRNSGNKQNSYENKRIFNIVWRDVSTKKHKTWKSDGTLEVNICTVKAILKDETGKYLGSSTKFNRNNLAPDFQMVIGGKEIEIQNEIIDEDEFYELRKRQVQNRNLSEKEWIYSNDLAEEQKKPKGGFKFKPILVLKSPDVPSNGKTDDMNETRKSNWEKNEYLSSQTTSTYKSKPDISSSNQITSAPTQLQPTLNAGHRQEFLCFIRPSELQQFLFLKAYEYYSSVKSCLTLEKIQSLDIYHVLLHICNHPSFINHKSTTNELMRHLIPSLPDWSEMGPFDSGKLEFVQYFLTDLTKYKSQNCIILAKNTNVLNMLQGLCDFMNIKCLRLNIAENTKEQVITELKSLGEGLAQVLLVNSIEMFVSFDFSTCCKKLIIFEESSKNMNVFKMLDKIKDIAVYYLVTAFSIEELLLHDKYRNNKEHLLELLDELINMDMDNNCCYLHNKIECNCFESTDENIESNNIFRKNWQHFLHPFDVELLKISFLKNSTENIVSIFYRNCY